MSLENEDVSKGQCYSTTELATLQGGCQETIMYILRALEECLLHENTKSTSMCEIPDTVTKHLRQANSRRWKVYLSFTVLEIRVFLQTPHSPHLPALLDHLYSTHDTWPTNGDHAAFLSGLEQKMVPTVPSLVYINWQWLDPQCWRLQGGW